MQNSTEASVAVIDGVAVTIGEMREIAGSIAAAVEEQSATMKEVARNISEAATGTASVQSDITAVGEAVLKSKNDSADVMRASSDINARARELDSAMAEFVVNLRKTI
jgi:hypothetical protein